MYSKRQTTLKVCIFFKLAVMLYYLIVSFKLSDISQLERFCSTYDCQPKFDAGHNYLSLCSNVCDIPGTVSNRVTNGNKNIE